MHSAQGNFPLASSRYMRADIYAGQMWLLIILLARHLHAYGELLINYCERRLKVFFFSDNHLAFLSHVQICMLLIIQIFLWLLLWLAEKIFIQIWKMFKTREVTYRGWSGAEVVLEFSIKYSFQPHHENHFFWGEKMVFLGVKKYFFFGIKSIFGGQKSTLPFFYSGWNFNTDDDDDLFSSGSTIPIPSKAKMAVPKKRGSLSGSRRNSGFPVMMKIIIKIWWGYWWWW